jgi:NAD(P)-dependent dehydrogenase (short-subunit alcohol dehydrogenase family)
MHPLRLCPEAAHMDLSGRTILVTGAARRLGRAIALELARAGARLLIHHSASDPEAAETCQAIRALGSQAQAFRADLRQQDQIKALFAQLDSVGPLHALVNSAAVMLPGDLLSVSEDDWHATIDLNLKAAFFVLQQAALRIRAAGGGVIINIADVAGLQPMPRFPVHSISKAGVLSLTRVAALALAPDIRVNAIVPGPVLKPDRMSDARWESLGQALPLQRTGTPEDVARSVHFLLENDFITGEALIVDGGNQFIAS